MDRERWIGIRKKEEKRGEAEGKKTKKEGKVLGRLEANKNRKKIRSGNIIGRT